MSRAQQAVSRMGARRSSPSPTRRLRISRLAILTALLAVCGPATTWAEDDLPHEAYVWQRRWTDSLKHAIRQHGARFARLVVLGAEIRFDGNLPEVVCTEVDHEVLRAAKCPVGMALRIGPFPGPFRADDRPMRVVAETAASLLRKAQEAGLTLAECQIDFDCATRNLRGYRTWLETLAAVVGVPLTFTALPDWLGSDEFPGLARASGGFVLQVHSLERPTGPDAAICLCDPGSALAAVGRASRLDVPFRVALPTYGYVVAFDAQGHYAGIAAGGLAGASPTARIREVRADPVALAGLVRGWRLARPACMAGIIWYRFPCEGDELNWRWTTLNAIMQGRVPQGQLTATAVRRKPRLWDIRLSNEGDADASLSVRVAANWPGGRLVASDPLQGFETSDVTTNRLELRLAANALPTVLPPGEERAIGWLRLADDTEVDVGVLPLD